MNELSRMERHRSRHKGRKKEKAAESGGKAVRSNTKLEDLDTNKEAESNSALGSRSRNRTTNEHSSSNSRNTASGEGLSRSRSVRSGGTGAEEQTAPSRANTYPSHRVRMSKWFVNALIIIFILLMAGLLIWGLIGAPPLEEIL